MQVYSKPFDREAFVQGLGGIVGSATGVRVFLLRVKILGTRVVLLQHPFIIMSVAGLEGSYSS